MLFLSALKLDARACVLFWGEQLIIYNAYDHKISLSQKKSRLVSRQRYSVQIKELLVLVRQNVGQSFKSVVPIFLWRALTTANPRTHLLCNVI